MSIVMKPNDAAWMFIEKPEQPCHVASLSVFSPPPGAASDYVRQLVAQFEATRVFAPPFNYVLRRGVRGKLVPTWDELPADQIDLEYHFRHSALPAPGGELELGKLVSRLHSHALDFRRPLWELHLIEGLEHGRFAIYMKLHHSQMDGMAGVALWNRVMSLDADARNCQAPWAVGLKSSGPKNDRQKPSQAEKNPGNPAAAMLPALQAIGDLVKAAKNPEHPLQAMPYGAPRSVLNGRIHGQRRVATQTYTLARIQAVARKAEVSVNDVFLAICGGGLRRYLMEQGKLPLASLTAGLPVSVRPAGDVSVGNAISFMFAKLCTDIADPLARLRGCHESTALAKEHLQRMPKDVMESYTMLAMGPYLAQVALGLAGFGRPSHNLIVSNVPGERRPQYFNGARLEQLYPISALFNGQAVNISVFSCGGNFSLGFVGCRDSLPSIQKLAVYTGAALSDLEAALSTSRE
ncbi:wax ester/triacylglycerol synthase family O-acyltransferase [Solimonas sp. K1W22B-7]|uniref:WS/DGAT/MGAT family O-acyltransferase n=1 Tax=Solimonas sp. K1W22B-7 TaxID=2303331 RepID=UPI000E333F19|nr:wax ester/triacylglycerol synthase family O-acyltransferase [Solimonas sp. K1W22B-7]AXQ31127.1 wax ester/triacylglycerol synthase family O-acyltransferase [Solimonas sp. K1W22B-7]